MVLRLPGRVNPVLRDPVAKIFALARLFAAPLRVPMEAAGNRRHRPLPHHTVQHFPAVAVPRAQHKGLCMDAIRAAPLSRRAACKLGFLRRLRRGTAEPFSGCAPCPLDGLLPSEARTKVFLRGGLTHHRRELARSAAGGGKCPPALARKDRSLQIVLKVLRLRNSKISMPSPSRSSAALPCSCPLPPVRP